VEKVAERVRVQLEARGVVLQRIGAEIDALIPEVKKKRGA
jgi:hypothetical protein